MAFNRRGLLTIEQVKEIEEKIGHKFPDDYKDFLLKTNGGRFDFEDEHGFYVDPIDEENIYVDMLFGIGKEWKDFLIYFNEQYGNDAGGILIIGNTLSHGFVVYDYLGDLGKKGIYFWDDTYAYECTSDEQNVYFIADDFKDFMEKTNMIIN